MEVLARPDLKTVMTGLRREMEGRKRRRRKRRTLRAAVAKNGGPGIAPGAAPGVALAVAGEGNGRERVVVTVRVAEIATEVSTSERMNQSRRSKKQE